MLNTKQTGSIAMQGSVISTTFKKNIVSIDSIPDESVAYNTIFDDLQLPPTINVLLDDNTTLSLGIIWDEGDYNETIIDTYILTGTIVLPDQILNSNNFIPTINVTIFSLPEARNITVPSLQYGVKVNASYKFFQVLNVLESNKPIHSEDIILTASTFFVGQQITANFIKLVIPNGGTGGTHTYNWYRCIDTRESLDVLITGTTSNTYTVQEIDAGYFIRVEGFLKQIGVGYTTGETVYSIHSPIILSSTFNPYANILWGTAQIPSDLLNFSGLTYWYNRGNLGNSVQDGTSPLPTYDTVEHALRFLRSASQRLLIAKQSPAMAQPFEIWIRIKFASLTGNQYIFGFSNSSYIYINSTGFININGNLSTVSLTANIWYAIRIVINDTSTTIQVNNGGVVTTNSGTISIGSGTGRIGCSFAKANFMDAWINHIFMRDDLITSGDLTNMWAYFGY